MEIQDANATKNLVQCEERLAQHACKQAFGRPVRLRAPCSNRQKSGSSVRGCFPRRQDGGDPDPVCLISTIENWAPPVAALEVPANGLFNAGFEALPRAPAKLRFDLRGVDGVTPVVARPIADKRYKRASRLSFAGRQVVKMIADRLDDMQVCALVLRRRYCMSRQRRPAQRREPGRGHDPRRKASREHYGRRHRRASARRKRP